MVKADKKDKASSKKKAVDKIRSKKYTESIKKVDRDKEYTIDEACGLVKEISTTKFDSSVEIHLRLNFDTTKDSVRGSVVLPGGSGKTKKIIVFADDKEADAAKKAGAVEAGSKELIEKIQKGWLDFDVAIAHPSMMPQVGKLGKILGTKGMMPNPKAGTVTPDVVKAVEEFSKGKTEFKADSNAIIHLSVGKVSFEPSKIKENILSVVEAANKAKPQKIKGKYIVSLFLAPTMGPSVKVNSDKL
jgi:large subunit ribosomal protein L1